MTKNSQRGQIFRCNRSVLCDAVVDEFVGRISVDVSREAWCVVNATKVVLKVKGLGSSPTMVFREQPTLMDCRESKIVCGHMVSVSTRQKQV